MIEYKPKRILIAPLDWGLGHTTRCLPLIGHLQRMGHQVVVACNEWQRSFIEKTCNNIEFTLLGGYNITYKSARKPGKATNLLLLPRIYKAIHTEQQWLLQHIAALKVDGIISDNRYGLYSSEIPCVILTHQLQIQTGMGNIVDRMVQRLHYRLLEKFNQVWVPDVAGTPNLGGTLSHTQHLPKKTSYIGLLSQFEKIVVRNEHKGYLLVLLSGPEPQRSILSTILWQQLKSYTGKVIFVAGSETPPPDNTNPEHITYYTSLTGQPLAEIISSADMVICRSGYSTIMDLVLLGKKAIIIPTPGQTEQEYLAIHLQEQGMFPYVAQYDFNLATTMAKAQIFTYLFPDLQESYGDYEKVMAQWLNLPNGRQVA